MPDEIDVIPWSTLSHAEMAEQDERGAISLARQEGHKEGHKEGRAEGHKEGLLTGKRDAFSRLLERRRLTITEEDRARTEACTDIATPDRWFDQALVARTAAEVFA